MKIKYPLPATKYFAKPLFPVYVWRLPTEVLYLLSSNFLYLGSGFLVIYIAARLLSLPDFSEFSLFFSTSGLFGGAIGLGVGSRFLPLITRTAAQRRLARLRRRAVADTLLLSLLACLLFFGLAYRQDTALALTLFIAAGLVAQALFFVGLQIEFAQRHGRACLAMTSSRIVALTLAVVAAQGVAFWTSGSFATIACTFVTLVLLTADTVPALPPELRHITRRIRRKRWRVAWLRSLWRSTLYTSNGFVPVWIQSMVPLDLASTPSGMCVLAYFNVGRQWQSAIQVIGGTLSSYFLPRVCRSGTLDAVQLRRNVLLSTLYATAVVVGAFVLAPIIHYVYFGGPYRSSGLILVVLFVASAYVQYVNPHSNVSFASGRVSPAIAQNLGLAAAFSATYFLLPGTFLDRLCLAVLVGGAVQFLLQIALFRMMFPRFAALGRDLLFLSVSAVVAGVGICLIFFPTVLSVAF